MALVQNCFLVHFVLFSLICCLPYFTALKFVTVTDQKEHLFYWDKAKYVQMFSPFYKQQTKSATKRRKK